MDIVMSMNLVFTFTIEGTLPNLNDYILACRANKYAAAAMKQKAEKYVMRYISSNVKVKDTDYPLCIHYVWVEPTRRRDLDNISSFGRKVIQDALVKSGVIAGDGWKHISGFSDAFDVDKQHPRVEVQVFKR